LLKSLYIGTAVQNTAIAAPRGVARLLMGVAAGASWGSLVVPLTAAWKS
jgi:hypothetical protein